MTPHTRYLVFRVIRFAFVLLLLAGCQRRVIPVTQPVPVLNPPAGVPEDAMDPLYAGLKAGAQVHAFYRDVAFTPQWGRHPGLADSLVRILRDAGVYGLEPLHYHADALKDTTLIPMRHEILLTDAFLAFGHDLRYGRGDSSARPPADSVRRAVLREVLSGGAMRSGLESLEPPFEGYRHLRVALGRLIRSGASAKSIRTVVLNLERWRKEQSTFGTRYILVQVPGFMLYVVEGDSVLLTSRVIVGEPETPTPELTGMITRVVTYPYWHVPRKIAVKEYLPAIQQDISVLSRNNFEVLDREGAVLNPDSVDWKSFSPNNFPVSLRQKEGRENALGVIKFEFKNPYAVFLHDTNSRRLFREEVRAFSHGCIRMEQAEKLAHYLLTGNIQGQSTRLERLLTQRERHVITLSAPMPIYVRYFTAEVRDGELRFYEDLYGKDGLD